MIVIQSNSANNIIEEQPELSLIKITNYLKYENTKVKFIFTLNDTNNHDGNGIYSDLQILEKTNDEYKIVFSLLSNISSFDGVYIRSNSMFYFEDKNKNGINEIYLVEYPYASSPERYIIIEKYKGKYLMMLCHSLKIIEVKDIDNDGNLEIFGYVGSGGGGYSVFGGFDVAGYKLDTIGHKYLPSKDISSLFYKYYINKWLTEFNRGSNIQILDSIIKYAIYDKQYTLVSNLINNNYNLVSKLILTEDPDILKFGFYEKTNIQHIFTNYLRNKISDVQYFEDNFYSNF